MDYASQLLQDQPNLVKATALLTSLGAGLLYIASQT